MQKNSYLGDSADLIRVPQYFLPLQITSITIKSEKGKIESQFNNKIWDNISPSLSRQIVAGIVLCEWSVSVDMDT